MPLNPILWSTTTLVVYVSFPEFPEPHVIEVFLRCFPAWVPDRVIVRHIVHVHGLLPEEPGSIVGVVFAAVGTCEPVRDWVPVVVSPVDELPFLHLQDCPAVVTGDLEDFFLTGSYEFLVSSSDDYHMFFLVCINVSCY